MRNWLVIVALAGCERSGVTDDCATSSGYVDRDGDGFGAGAATERCSPEGFAAADGDCDDANAAVFPGAVEVCNGVDDDCAGAPDEGATDAADWFVDADGDGFGSGAPVASCAPVEGHAPRGGDCADRSEELPPGAQVAPGDVHPGAEDVPYDGVDADCAGDNDFDVDGDLYVRAGDADAYAAYVAFYGYLAYTCAAVSSGAAAFGICGGADCDDADPDTHPYDADDVRGPAPQGCAALDEDAWVGTGDAWSELRNVVIVRSGRPPEPPVEAIGPAARAWFVVTAAGSSDASAYQEIGIALEIDDEGQLADTQEWFVPQTNLTSQAHGLRIDALDAPDGFYAGVGYTNQPTCTEPCAPQPPSTVFLVKHVFWDPLQDQYRNQVAYHQLSGVFDDLRDLDLRADGAGRLWALGCGATFASYLVVDTSSTFPMLARGCLGDGACTAPPAPLSAERACFLEPPATASDVGRGAVCDGTSCTAYDLDAADPTGGFAVSATQEHASLAFGDAGVDWNDGWTTIVPPSGPGVTVIADGGSPRVVLEDLTVMAASASAHAGTLYVAAVVPDQTGDGLDDVLVAWGPGDGALAERAVTRLLARRGTDTFVFAPSSVAVRAEDVGVLVAAGGHEGSGGCLSAEDGRCDVVAWQILRAE